MAVRLTPEERKKIFADVQARSKAKRNKRRKTMKGMAATLADTAPDKKSTTVAMDMAPEYRPTIRGAVNAFHNRKQQLKEIMK